MTLEAALLIVNTTQLCRTMTQVITHSVNVLKAHGCSTRESQLISSLVYWFNWNCYWRSKKTVFVFTEGTTSRAAA